MKHLITRGKFFLPPPSDGSDFKELFKQLAAAGAGRPADKDGFPAGPWTPELLAEAISQIDANRVGIDLRTVQLWFQDNEKGISADNIRWLSRILGCDDPVATSEWQMELSAAQSRLTAKRRERKRAESSDAQMASAVARTVTLDGGMEIPAELASDADAKGPRRGFSLARKSEAFFIDRSALDLPTLVFAGAVALGFLSYIFDIHSVHYFPVDGQIRQVGFLWAANWMVVFLVALPLFLAAAGELLDYWKAEGRPKLLAPGIEGSDDGWVHNVEAFSYSYWAVLFICLPVAFLFQWIDVCLVPLMTGDVGNYPIDWGKMAVVRPEIISVPEAVVFTGLAYLYMGVCFYLFFTGLILLYTMVHDLLKIDSASKLGSIVNYQHDARAVCPKIMRGIFRCTVLGLIIAIFMKLQSMFLISEAETIVSWLVDDFLSFLGARAGVGDGSNYGGPSLFSSFLVVLASCAVFLSGSVRIHGVLARSGSSEDSVSAHGRRKRKGVDNHLDVPFGMMTGIVALLVANYLLIGVFSGFSILLSVGLLVTIYSLFDPGFGQGRWG